MFTVATQRDLSRAKEYFDEHLSVNDYYTAEDLRPSQWIGRGAEQLGLQQGQTVTREVFRALCDNLHPQTGQRLRRGLPPDPDENPHARTARHSGGGERFRKSPRRHRARHRPDRLGKIDHARGVDGLHQRQLHQARHHRRGADRVRAPEQKKRHHAA